MDMCSYGNAVVCTAGHIVPNVVNVVVLEYAVVIRGCVAYYAVIRACSQEEEIRIIILELHLTRRKKIGVNSGCRTNCANISENVGMCQTNINRFSSAHREACDSCVFSSGFNGIVSFYERHKVVKEIIYEVVVCRVICSVNTAFDKLSILACIDIREYNDHFLSFTAGNSITNDLLEHNGSITCLIKKRIFVSPIAVKCIQNRIFLVLIIVCGKHNVISTLEAE